MKTIKTSQPMDKPSQFNFGSNDAKAYETNVSNFRKEKLVHSIVLKRV